MKKIHVIFEKWYLGYVIILVFVLMVVGYTNTWFYKNYKAQTENINEYVKDGVVQNLNDFFRTIDSVALNICTDEGIDLLNGASNLNDLYRNTTALKLVENMYKFGKISDDIGEIYIYNKNNDVVVSSKGIYGSKHFYDMSIAPCGEDYKQWKHRIDDIGTGHRFERYNNKIEYNIKLDSGNINKSKNGNIVFGIIFDKKSFINDIPYVEWIKRCNIYIYDSNGSLCIYEKTTSFNGLPEFPELIDFEKQKKNMDTVFSDIIDGGRKYTIVFAFEKAINVMQMKKFQAISICTFIFYALLCFLFMYYMYISNILPIKQFADMFGISVKGFNFEYLKKSIKELVDNNYRIENQLKNQRLDISKLIIKKLLIGGSSAEYANMLDEYSMGFKFKNFLVIIIGFYSDVNNTTVDESIILEKFKDNIETMLNDENGFVYVVNDKARIVGLYNTAHNDSEITKIVSRKIAYIVNYMGSKYDFVASAAISKVHSGYNEIVMCYSEAVETMEQCGLNNQPSIIMYEDIEKDRKYVFTISQENELLIAIKNCDEEGAKKIIDDSLISVNEENVVLYKQMFVGILYALIKIAKTITNNNYNSEKLINSMQNIDDYENIHSVCISEIEEMCDRVKSTTEHNNNYLAEYVKNYITDNYDDSEISIEDLCQSIHYSTTYINNIFKKFYNTSFSEYLSRYRIDMSSDFIQAGYTSIETAKKTGFTNVRTFNRAFKKHTGLTPSQYKRLHFKDNE